MTIVAYCSCAACCYGIAANSDCVLLFCISSLC